MSRHLAFAGIAVVATAALASAAPSATPDDTTSTATVVIPECVRGSITPETTPDELALLANTECIPVYDQRPDKPFDRDTEVRLTGDQLAARGAVDLATALALLPDVALHDAGRGGFNIDIRGGRKGEVTVIIDGVVVTDPFYGTFDLTSIPITDVVQIRLATTPQSPIDGPGGPGGVIEVTTRDAIGAQLVIVRLEADTLPSAGATATARTPLTDRTALRLSLGSTVGGHDFTLDNGAASLNEQRHDTNGAARLEYRDGDLRAVTDVFVDARHYIAPPADTNTDYLDVDRETTVRADAKVDDKLDGIQVQGELGAQYLRRVSRTFVDLSTKDEAVLEDLSSWRESGFVLATAAFAHDWRWAASTTLEHDSCEVGSLARVPTVGDATELEPAGDLQYEHGTLRLDGSVGELVPIGIPASPYLEAKLVSRWTPRHGPIELIATLGRKGRVPTLQERFDLVEGNPGLAPELSYHAELRAIAKLPDDRLRVEVAPFARHVDDLIRASETVFTNLGTTDFWGLDAIGRVRVVPMVEVGGGYSYIQVQSQSDPGHADNVIDDHPLNRLPANRGEGWVQVTPLPQLSAIARVTYFGDFYNSMGGRLQVLPGWSLLEATATWRISTRYLVVVRGNDLTNVRPQTRPHVYGDGTEITAILQATY